MKIYISKESVTNANRKNAVPKRYREATYGEFFQEYCENEEFRKECYKVRLIWVGSAAVDVYDFYYRFGRLVIYAGVRASYVAGVAYVKKD